MPQTPPDSQVDYTFDLQPITPAAYVAGQRIVFEPYRAEKGRIDGKAVAKFLAIVVLGTPLAYPFFHYGFSAELEIYSARLRTTWIYDGYSLFFALLGVGLICAGLTLLAVRAGGVDMVRWMHRHSRGWQEPGRLEFSEAGLVSVSTVGTRTIPWSSVTGFRRAKGYWFIVIDTITYIWLTDSLVKDPAEFAAHLERKIAAATPSTAPLPRT